LFTAHRCSEAKELARQFNIRLEFIPAGATGEYQPLDRMIFGNLKSRTGIRFDRLWIVQKHEPAMQDSIAMMFDAWKSIGQNEVLDAWDQLRQQTLHCYAASVCRKDRTLGFQATNLRRTSVSY
jgi:hypothetical protein